MHRSETNFTLPPCERRLIEFNFYKLIIPRQKRSTVSQSVSQSLSHPIQSLQILLFKNAILLSFLLWFVQLSSCWACSLNCCNKPFPWVIPVCGSPHLISPRKCFKREESFESEFFPIKNFKAAAVSSRLGWGNFCASNHLYPAALFA